MEEEDEKDNEDDGESAPEAAEESSDDDSYLDIGQKGPTFGKSTTKVAWIHATFAPHQSATSAVTMKSPRQLSCLHQLHGFLEQRLGSFAIPSNVVLDESFFRLRRSFQPQVDYQSSVCFGLAKQAKQSPHKLGQAMLRHLESSVSSAAAASSGPNVPLVQHTSVSDKGFINFKLNEKWIAKQLLDMATDGVAPTPISSASKKVLVDFCSPNLGKKLHVGHLRSCVIGDTLANLLEFRGMRVTRINHLGDIGSAFATLLAQLIDQQVMDIESLSDDMMAHHYENGKKRFKHDETFRAKVNGLVLQLQQQFDSRQANNPDHARLIETWRKACLVSRAKYENVFQRLNITVTDRSESTYLPLIPETLEALKSSHVAELSRGALCIFVDGKDKPPMLIQKSDGGFLYATTDLAALYSRIFGFPGVDDTRYDEIVYVTDQSQQLHFQQLFKAAQLAKWTSRGQDTEQVKLVHAAFGLVLGKDGTKLSSRNGAFDFLEDLLDEATKECTKRSIVPENVALNQQIGDAAVRYFDLAQQRERSYKFSFDQVLQLKGNTGVYLLYACARLQGILRKGQTNGSSWLRHVEQWKDLLALEENCQVLQDAANEWQEEERQLALLLCQFDDEVELTIKQLQPHLLCDYLYRVVSQFHSFYEHCRVHKDPKERSRLLLCAATDAVLRRGLQLVGIQAIDRM